MVPLGNHSRADDLVEPLVVDFSCFHSSNNSCSVKDVWDGENILSDNVSQWVASKLKSTVGCIRVAFSGYEYEVIQLPSRIEKSNVMPKPSVQRTPPSTRRRR